MAGVTFVSLRAIVEMVLACTLSAHRNAEGHLYLYVVCMYVCSIRMFDSLYNG